MLNDSTKKSMRIIKELLMGHEVSDLKNNDIKGIYKLESNVANEIDEILDIFDLDIFEGQEGELFISPRVENNIFGYKNDEIRSMLKVGTNLEMYLCYFIMYSLMTMFYRDTTGRLSREYISVDSLVEEVNLKLGMLKDMLDDEKISVDEIENQEGCHTIIDYWFNKTANTSTGANSMDERDSRSKTKVGYCNRTLMFFENQGLLHFDKMTYKYSPKDRFRTIVMHAYANSNYNYMGLLNRKLKIEEAEELDTELS